MLDVIKEYLVSIGFAINAAQYNKVNNQLNQLTALFNTQSGSMSRNVTAACKYMTVALVGVTSSIVGMVAQQAKAQIEYQKFGTQMWINTRVAKDFKIALDAMDESMQDIAWNPELRGQFKSLVNLSEQLRTPDDAVNRFRGIRDILFSVKQLKVEMKYGMEWVSYYLTKYFDGPLKDVKKTLDSLHKNIISNMPKWTNHVAKFFASLLAVGGHALEFVQDIWRWLTKLWDSFPSGVKKAIVALGLLTAVINMSPFGQLITALSTILLLLDDYYGWKEGKESALSDIWSEIDVPIQELSAALLEAGDALGDVIDLTLQLFGLYDGTKSNKMQRFWSFVGKAVENVADQIKLVALGIKMITGLFTTPWDAKGKKEYRKIEEEFFNQLKNVAHKAITFGDFGRDDTGGKPVTDAVRKRLKPYDKTIKKASELYGVPEELIRRVIQQESNGYQGVRSRKGAIGLMQLMPDTAKKLKVNPLNPNENIMGGVHYLADLYKKYGSWELALAAYNAGPGNVDKHGGIPHFSETRNYLKSILGQGNGVPMSYLTPQYRGTSGGNAGSVTFGDINVTVPEPGASANEIADAVGQKLSNLDGVQILRRARDLSGVLV